MQTAGVKVREAVERTEVATLRKGPGKTTVGQDSNFVNFIIRARDKIGILSHVRRGAGRTSSTATRSPFRRSSWRGRRILLPSGGSRSTATATRSPRSAARVERNPGVRYPGMGISSADTLRQYPGCQGSGGVG